MREQAIIPQPYGVMVDLLSRTRRTVSEPRAVVVQGRNTLQHTPGKRLFAHESRTQSGFLKQPDHAWRAMTAHGIALNPRLCYSLANSRRASARVSVREQAIIPQPYGVMVDLLSRTRRTVSEPRAVVVQGRNTLGGLGLGLGLG